jgi:uncharacterized repeat protein (TIGR01451 family)
MFSSKRILPSAIVLIGIVLCLTGEAGGVEFSKPSSYAVGIGPISVAVGDFNGDGKLDLAVANAGSKNVSVLLGNGDGTFQTAANFDAGLTPGSIAVGDFNGDGKLDLALFQGADNANSVAGSVAVLLGKGDGTFQPPKVSTLTVSASQMAAGDFNSDKKADLVVSNVDASTGSVTLEIMFSNGDGTFQSAKTVPSQAQSGNFLVADFNNDGKPDLAIAVPGGAQILLGQGDGTFQAGASAVVADGFSVGSALAVDLNHDGNSDLIVTSYEFQDGPITSTLQHVSVFMGEIGGTFANEQVIFTGGSSRDEFGFGGSNLIGGLWTGNFNGDGSADLLDFRTWHYSPPFEPGGSALELRLNKGDGSFVPLLVLNDLQTVPDLVQDLNGDNLSDVITLDPSNNAILVSLNQSPAAGADLAIASAGPAGAELGQGLNFTYSARVLNEGPEAATNVTFTDNLPAGVTLVSATSTQGTCSNANLIVNCSVGSLSDTADVQIAIVVTPLATGALTNTMSVSGTEPDLATDNNTVTLVDTVLPVFTLTVTKTGNATGTVTGNLQLNPPQPQIKCGSACSQPYLSGTTIYLSELPDSGSSFQGWGGACSGNSETCQVTVNADTAVTATFVVSPVLTLKIAGDGAGTVTSNVGPLDCTNAGGTCSSSYDLGSSLSLTATPSSNSIFAGWSGACSGMDPNTCVVTMNSDESVVATFNPQPDFGVTAAQPSLMLNSGGQASDTLSFAATGGFSGTISLGCSVAGPNTAVTCALVPNSVGAGGSTTLTVSAATAAILAPAPLTKPPLFALGLLLGFPCWVFAMTAKSKRRVASGLSLCALSVTMLWGCGSTSGGTQRHPQNYTITVTAKSGALQHATSIAVTVD